MDLQHLVKLYRLCDRPKIVANRFSTDARFSAECSHLLDGVRSTSPNSIEELVIDGKEIPSSWEVPNEGSSFYVSVLLPASSDDRFYNSVCDLIERAANISKGRLPSEFYLCQEDIYSREAYSNDNINKIESFCRVIRHLSGIAHYHDEKSRAEHLRLVFIRHHEEGANTFVLQTEITTDFLKCRAVDDSFLEEVCGAPGESDPHNVSKREILASTLVEFLSGTPRTLRPFYYLIDGWADFSSLYKNNLAIYLSGFAFHKAKREIAESEAETAHQFSRIVIDVSGKLLAIPISFGATVGIIRSENIAESSFIVLGLLVAALLVSAAVGNQQRQLRRIGDAKDLVFGALEGNRAAYPSEIQDRISIAQENLGYNEDKLRRLLWAFRGLSWLPVVVALLIHTYQYSPSGKACMDAVFGAVL